VARPRKRLAYASSNKRLLIDDKQTAAKSRLPLSKRLAAKVCRGPKLRDAATWTNVLDALSAYVDDRPVILKIFQMSWMTLMPASSAASTPCGESSKTKTFPSVWPIRFAASSNMSGAGFGGTPSEIHTIVSNRLRIPAASVKTSVTGRSPLVARAIGMAPCYRAEASVIV